MNSIPAGIETSLLAAGFTPTEVLVVRKLMESDALTLRELAARTGKGIGVLDQAVKKLLRKNILRRDTINDSAKYTLTSLDQVLHWVETDMNQKREVLQRQHQNFEQFIRTFEQDKKRPDIQYFDGLDGLATAYRKLLERGKEMLAYVPVFCSIEDHPLRDFMVEWFRIRRNHGVFLRVIAHDTPLGRRYVSRDPFEYRQTVLVDEKTYPFTFEKIISGDTVACINYAEKRACLLRYPELSTMEKSLFEGIWKQEQKKDVSIKSTEAIVTAIKVPNTATIRVRVLSALREFFLSKKSAAIILVIMLLAIVVAFAVQALSEPHSASEVSTRIFKFMLSFSATFLLFITVRLAAANKSLIKELWSVFKIKKILLIAALCLELSFAITFAIYKYSLNQIIDEIGMKTMAAMATASTEIKTEDLIKIQSAEDMKTDSYQSLFQKLNLIRTTNPHIKYVYIMRYLPKENVFEFVVDANSNFNLPAIGPDLNGDGIINQADENVFPGVKYPVEGKMLQALETPLYESEFFADQWGTWISAYAPLKNNKAKYALLGADVDISDVYASQNRKFSPWLWFSGIFGLLALLSILIKSIKP